MSEVGTSVIWVNSARKTVKDIDNLAADRFQIAPRFRSLSSLCRPGIDRVSLGRGCVRHRASVCWAALGESMPMARIVEAVEV